MIQSAIHVENLGKQYCISATGNAFPTLGDQITRIIQAPFTAAKTHRKAPNETFWALKDVSFDVRPGEVVGVVGRNGAGKSTLLKLLSRITEPTVGRVRLRGRLASLLEVGTGFHPELTGRENVYLNGAILGMSRHEIQSRFDEIVEFAEVARFLETPVKRYSSGMYLRLAFAVAAHLDPEILLVDEVLAVGDASFQKKCLGKIRDVAGLGRTVLFVSHSLGAVSSLCTSAIWLDHGQVRGHGETRTILQDYLSANSHFSTGHIELTEQPRPGTHYATQLRLTGIELPTQGFIHSETQRVTLHADVISDVCDVSFIVGFATSEGTRLLTYETGAWPNERRGFSTGEHIEVEMAIADLPLAPGVYSINIAVRSGDYWALDYLPSCFQIEIKPGDQTPAVLHRPDQAVNLRPSTVWK